MLKRTGIFILLFPLMSQSFAATTDNGCGKDSNDRINPEIALCSTHVYNIGEVENPSTESDKQLMRDVVALKSTVMTQQMYKQYEYLESMIRRFKTQLEKAVLTTKLQAAGADGSSSGGSSYSSGGSYSSGVSVSRDRVSNIKLDGAQDCAMKSYQDAYSCLISNIQLVINAANNRSVGEATKQLQADLAVAKNWGIICGNGNQYCKCETGKSTCDQSDSLSSCNYLSSSSLVKCAQQFNAVVSRASYDLQNANRQVKGLN